MDKNNPPKNNGEDADPAIQSLTKGEEIDAMERAGPRAPVVYASISARGLEELNRPIISLFGSGISAGLILMMSVLAEGLIHHQLPEFQGAELIADIGYTFGFLIVIIGRMQLFTEDTITPVLPLLANPTKRAFWRTGRLWSVVFTANLIGTFVAAFTLTYGDIIRPDQLHAVIEVAAKVQENTPLETLRYGIIAGFLIAALVWCMPTMRGGEFMMIFFITYLIALGDFTHVIAGSGEGFLLFLDGRVDGAWLFYGLIGPALIGNVIGGTVLFAVLAYVQVMEEISEDRKQSRNRIPYTPRPKGFFAAPSSGATAAAPATRPGPARPRKDAKRTPR